MDYLTKDDLGAALAPLPTGEEMHSAIDKAVAPLATRAELLATREDLQRALREDGEQTRRHFDVVAESLRGDIRLLAEGQRRYTSGSTDVRIELKGDIAKLDRRVMHLEVARG